MSRVPAVWNVVTTRLVSFETVGSGVKSMGVRPARRVLKAWPLGWDRIEYRTENRSGRATNPDPGANAGRSRRRRGGPLGQLLLEQVADLGQELLRGRRL